MTPITPPNIDDKPTRETTYSLQTIMLDVLQRRAVMSALEEKAIGKVPEGDTTLTVLAADYVRSQLSDLRKFFETDGRSHRLKDLTAKLPASSQVKLRHDALFATWNSTYEQVANRYYFHREKGYTPPPGFSRAVLDRFVDDVDQLLDETVRALTDAGYIVEYLVRDRGPGGYITQVKADASKFFESI